MSSLRIKLLWITRRRYSNSQSVVGREAEVGRRVATAAFGIVRLFDHDGREDLLNLLPDVRLHEI